MTTIYKIAWNRMTMEVQRYKTSRPMRMEFLQRSTPARNFGALKNKGYYAARVVELDEEPVNMRWHVLCPEADGRDCLSTVAISEHRKQEAAERAARLWRRYLASTGETSDAAYEAYREAADICADLGVLRRVVEYTVAAE